ncbi:riboflavin kinase [Aureococcus anophagefferens]|nr:riboflavin kinase [Aureococcus anophagefferens]
MSVGWNPHFGDFGAIEAWLLHDFEADFYDQRLKLVVVGYVRPELKFDSFDELIRDPGRRRFCGAALGHAAWPADAHFAAP